MSITATGMLNVARSQLGYREGPNNANKFGAWYGLDHAPYCAIGLMWCAGQLGVPKFFGGRFAYCPTWVKVAQQLGFWHRFNTTPLPGDVVFFDWTGRHTTAQHVGLVERVDHGTLVTIEFNTSGGSAGSQSDGGGVWRRRRNTSMVVGYGRPPYGAQSSPRPVPHATSVPLLVDGVWGAATTRKLQAWLHVPVTGALDAATKKGLQRAFHLTQDAVWGPTTRKTLQKFLGVSVDGVWGPGTIRALQSFLNKVA